MKTIWILTSIYNDYNQPENNLECAWEHKPSHKELANILGMAFDPNKGSKELGKLRNGEEIRINESDYKLREVMLGKKLD